MQQRTAKPRRLKGRKRLAATLLGEERGDAAIEMMLSVPIMVCFIFGLMQVCVAYYGYERISEMAREGTRYAMIRGATCETSTGSSCTISAATLQTYVTGLGIPDLAGGTTSAVATFPDGDEAVGHRVQVVVTYVFPYKIPYVESQSYTLSSTSVMYFQQ
jgi:Flp pilus assembly protein TadG